MYSENSTEAFSQRSESVEDGENILSYDEVFADFLETPVSEVPETSVEEVRQAMEGNTDDFLAYEEVFAEFLTERS